MQALMVRIPKAASAILWGPDQDGEETAFYEGEASTLTMPIEGRTVLFVDFADYTLRLDLGAANDE